jgi:regulator of nonsense transcripts 2
MAESFEKELEAQIDALGQLQELKKEKDEVVALRSSNLPSAVQGARKEFEANKKNLKSDLKKATAFVKKIRSINSEGLQQCIRDVETLNLTQHISEVVTAAVETAFKATDTPSMVKLCIALHKRYDEFTGPLVNGLRASLLSHPNEEDKEANKTRRIQIRFIIELYQAGLCLDDEFFCQLLRLLVGKSKGYVDCMYNGGEQCMYGRMYTDSDGNGNRKSNIQSLSNTLLSSY